MMKQKYFLILGIIAVLGIIFISGCVQVPKECDYCQYLENGKCINYACCSDSDCDDNNPGTIDICNNSKTLKSECQHIQKIQKEHYLVITKKGSDFYPLAEYLSEKKEAKLISYQSKFDEVLPELRNSQPEYLAIVLSPFELTPDVIDEIDIKLRNIDSDQFLDVAYGIITSFNVEEGYKYVDKLLQYSPKSEIKIYSPGMHGFYMNLKDDYGLDVTGHCIFSPSSWCDEEHKITAQRAVDGIKDSDVIAIVLHGNPSTMYMEGSEKLKGSEDGLYALDENGNKLPITTNAALVTAMSCTVGRINGKPSIIETELQDSDVEGVIEDSIILSFLESGALNFLAPTHVASSSIDPQETIIPQVILNGDPIGDALKTLKNNYIMNIIVNNKVFSGKPKVTDPFVNRFIEFQLRNWILFGDPEFRLRANKIEHPVCTQNVEESLTIENNKLIKKIKTKIILYDAFSTITKIEIYGDGRVGRTGGSGCMVHVPIESKDMDVKIEVENLIEDIIQKENLGDEIIFFVPDWALEKGGVPDFVKDSMGEVIPTDQEKPIEGEPTEKEKSEEEIHTEGIPTEESEPTQAIIE